MFLKDASTRLATQGIKPLTLTCCHFSFAPPAKTISPSPCQHHGTQGRRFDLSIGRDTASNAFVVTAWGRALLAWWRLKLSMAFFQLLKTFKSKSGSFYFRVVVLMLWHSKQSTFFNVGLWYSQLTVPLCLEPLLIVLKLLYSDEFWIRLVRFTPHVQITATLTSWCHCHSNRLFPKK